MAGVRKKLKENLHSYMTYLWLLVYSSPTLSGSIQIVIYQIVQCSLPKECKTRTEIADQKPLTQPRRRTMRKPFMNHQFHHLPLLCVSFCAAHLGRICSSRIKWLDRHCHCVVPESYGNNAIVGAERLVCAYWRYVWAEHVALASKQKGMAVAAPIPYGRNYIPIKSQLGQDQVSYISHARAVKNTPRP